jgi:hypothetical protein
MAVAGVVGDDVEEDADPVLARNGDQLVEVGQSTEVGMDGAVIADVVPQSSFGDAVIGDSQRASTPSRDMYSS